MRESSNVEISGIQSDAPAVGIEDGMRTIAATVIGTDDEPQTKKDGESAASSGAIPTPAPAMPAVSAPESADEPVAGPALDFRAPDSVDGYLDSCDGGVLTGWIANKTLPGESQEIEILVDGRLFARARADIFRGDLVQAGIGKGKHGFRFILPNDLYDDAVHSIEVRDLMTGRVMPGSPAHFVGKPAECGSIGIEGGAVVGWTRLPADVYASFPVALLEDGRVIAEGHATSRDDATNIAQFRLPLPLAALDGRPHAFTVGSKDPAVILGQLAVITPFMLTPEAALRQYAREGLKPSLANVAGFRYEDLVRSISRLAEEATLRVAGAPAPGKKVAAGQGEAWLGARLAQLVRVHERLVRGFAEGDKNFDPLVFPEVAQPRVSIVIPVHNKFPVTYHCLASLLLATNNASFEVILVDDGSKDETTRIPELIQGVAYLRNDEAQGFIRACNRGAAQARGDYIVMLNNDTEVTAGWLDELLWPFDHFDRVGMTGAKLIYPDGSLQEAGGIVWNTGDPWNYGRQANPRDPRYNYARQADYLSGACVMLPRPLWDELRGFDEAFVPAYFEDTDLAFRVRDKGYKTVYAPFAQIIHFEGVSSGTSTASGIKRYQEINRPKFKKRWVSTCRHNGNVGADLELNKDRNIQFRALVLDAETPMPDKNAGSYAAIQEMRMLQALGFKCTFIPANMAWMGRYTEELQRMGVECLYAPFAPSIGDVIERRGGEFDLIYITRYYVAKDYVDLIRQFAPKAKIVLQNADLHFLRELRAGLEAKNPEAIARAVQTREAELDVMRRVDLVLSYTDVEKAVILSHNLESSKVAKCPWVSEVATNVPGFESRADIAFLGGYNHHPNAEAVEWFAAHVMPLLRKACPGVRFRVYGSNVPARLLELAEREKDIVVEGWVADVADVYKTCRVFVAPLQSGAGIKGKVVGALAAGVPCVLSPIAAEGIPLGDGVDACITAKPEGWVAAIARLLEDELAWNAMSRQALRLAASQYGFEKGLAQMQEALQHAELFTTIPNNALAVH